MCFDEYRKLWIDSGFLNDKFVERDLSVCFCLSMMTVVDELTNDKIMEMYWIEFVEALGRAAELCDVFPISMPDEEVLLEFYDS